MNATFRQNTARYCCGVEEIGDFCMSFDATHSVLQRAGTGYYIGTFIDTPACRNAYEYLCSRYRLVCQTPPERNNNSSNKVFIAIFSTRKVKKQKPTTELDAQGRPQTWLFRDRPGEKLPKVLPDGYIG